MSIRNDQGISVPEVIGVILRRRNRAIPAGNVLCDISRERLPASVGIQ